MTLTRVSIEPLESGYVVTELYGSRIVRSAEPTWERALTLAARALGYHGTIEFGARTVEVPVVGMAPPNVGIPFDDEEPPLRAGTAKLGDKP